MNPVWLIAAACVLAAVHAFSPRLNFLDTTPRSRWLSFGAGVSLAYVFVHILPELAARQAEVFQSETRLWRAETELFAVALAGLIAFYSLERFARRKAGRRGAEGDDASAGVFWIHIGSFALYNALAGYILTQRESGAPGALGGYVFAMALHFLVNDRGLFLHHRQRYIRAGRWALAAAVIGGALLGLAVTVGELAVALLFAFLGGGVVLNVLKEELPEDRESRFGALAAGAVLYAVLLHYTALG